MTDQETTGVATPQSNADETSQGKNITGLHEQQNINKVVADYHGTQDVPEHEEQTVKEVPPLPEKEDKNVLQQLGDVTKTLEEREQLVLKQEKQIQELKQENKVLKEEKEALKREKDELKGHIKKELRQRDLEMKELRESQNVQIQDLEKQLRKLSAQRTLPTPNTGAAENVSNLQDHQTAPSELYYGSCVMDNKAGTAYFRDGYTDAIFAYNRDLKDWKKIPSCPNKDFALVIVDSLLTAVGGYNSAEKDTNKILSFTTADGEDDHTTPTIKRWVKIYPPMPTRRYTPAAVCTEKYLIVAGGSTGDKEPVSKVEVMNVETQMWWLAHSLPYHVTKACIAVSGDNVFVVGGMDHKKEWLTKVLSCSLQQMVQSAQSATLGTRLKRGLSRRQRQDLWQPIADVPTPRCTSITMTGQLLAIGGDSQSTYSSDVYAYMPPNDSWEVVGNMITPRARCLVVSLSDKEVMVVGGYTTLSDFKGSDTFEVVDLKTFEH